MSIYDFEVKTIEGKNTTLGDYKGKVLLIVNVASQCGFTPQYKGLEEVYRQFHAKGLEILGFPCNQFGSQEPGNAQEIKNFCETKYNVTFPLFEKIEVNGAGTHPLYAYLKSEEKGLLGTESIKWNFTKFLVSREGKVLKRFAPQSEPSTLVDEIKKQL